MKNGNHKEEILNLLEEAVQLIQDDILTELSDNADMIHAHETLKETSDLTRVLIKAKYMTEDLYDPGLDMSLLDEQLERWSDD